MNDDTRPLPRYEIYRDLSRWRWCWRDPEGNVRLRSTGSFITRNAAVQHVNDVKAALDTGDVEAKLIEHTDPTSGITLVWVGDGPCPLVGIEADPASN